MKAKFTQEFLHLVRGASFVFLCRSAGAVLVFVTQIFMARWMGAEQLGPYVFAFSSCLLLATVAGLGMPTAAIAIIGYALNANRSDLIRGFIRRSGQIMVSVGILLAVVGCAVTLLSDQVVPVERQAAMLFAFVTIPVFCFSSSRAGVALGLSWIAMSTAPNTVFRPLLFLGLMTAVWFMSGSLTAEIAMQLQLLAVAVMTAGQWLLLRRGLNKHFPDRTMAFETPVWIRTALPLLIITLFTNFFLELNVVVAGMSLPTNELAIFNAGFRVAALIAFGIAAVDTIMMPSVSKLHAASETDALQRIVSNAAKLRLWGAVAVSVPLFFFGEFLLSLFGEEFVPGFSALLILTGAQLISAAFGPAARLLSVTGYQDHCLGVSAVSLVAIIILQPLCIGLWGINGAAVAVCAVTLLQSAWMHSLAARHLNVRSAAFGKSAIRLSK